MHYAFFFFEYIAVRFRQAKNNKLNKINAKLLDKIQ